MTTSNNKKKYKYRLSHILLNSFHVFILSFLLIFSYKNWNNHDIINNWSLYIICIATFLFAVQILSFLIKKISFYDYRFWYICLSYLFMFGRVFLNAFQLDNNIFWDLLSRFPVLDLYHSSLIILIILESIFIGFIISPQQASDNISNMIIKGEKNPLMFNAGLLLLFLGGLARFIEDINQILQAQLYGSYSAIEGSSGIRDDIAILFVPSIIYIVASGSISKKKSQTLIFFVIIYFIIFMILTGDRRYPVTALLSLGLFYLKYFRVKIHSFRLVIISYFSLVLLNLFTVLRNIRLKELLTLNSFITNYLSEIFLNFDTLYETLAEFGLSFFSVVQLVQYVPEKIPFQWGSTILRSIPMILPIGWLFPDFFSKASISGIVNPLFGNPVGATIIGDIYVNFSVFSPVIAVIIGYVVVKILRQRKHESNRLYVARYFSIFYIMINAVRATFSELFRSSLIVWLFPILLMWLLKNSTSIKKGDYKR